MPPKTFIESRNPLGPLPVIIQRAHSHCAIGLIVLQEFWGVNEDIVDVAGTFAKAGGFLTAVPDLYRGKVTKDFEEAGHYMATLDWPGALTDIEAVAKHLLSIGCKSVGLTGFCMGGALSLAAADVHLENILAIAPFYGVPNSVSYDCTHIKIPVQAHYAINDDTETFSCKEVYDKLRERMEGAGVMLDFYEYSCGHAFMNPASTNYHKLSAELAFKRLVEFMHDKLA